MFLFQSPWSSTDVYFNNYKKKLISVAIIVVVCNVVPAGNEHAVFLQRCYGTAGRFLRKWWWGTGGKFYFVWGQL